MPGATKELGHRAKQRRAACHTTQKEVQRNVPFPGWLLYHWAAIIGERLRRLLIKRSLTAAMPIFTRRSHHILRLHAKLLLVLTGYSRASPSQQKGQRRRQPK